jgi:hypothetical protein
MPSLETIDLYDVAVLWARNGRDNRYGEPDVDAPVEIQCRWIQSRREVMGPDNTPIALDATVIVRQLVPIGSLMLLGTLNDWYGTGTGTGSGSSDEAIELMQVETHSITPDLRHRSTRREMGLVKFRGTLPPG